MIIRNRILPFPHFIAINIFGIIFTRRNTPLSEVDINHERIHTAQMLETLFVGFYLWYVIEWLVRLIILRNSLRAYRTIRFEREAYRHQHDLDYLSHRRFWAWARHDDTPRPTHDRSQNTTKSYHKHHPSAHQTS